MLSRGVRPDGKEVSFAYDALGRRTEKTYEGVTTHFVWDGNVPLHEWQEVSSDAGRADVTTWLFEQDTFIPAAKLAANGENFSIVSDYLGTPLQAFDNNGNKVWEQELDIFGRKRRKDNNNSSFIPFKYQGQYEDIETGLYYNRFRYYDLKIGNYISQDPIRLAGNNPTLYGYVGDLNKWADVFSLDFKTVDFSGHPDLYQGPGKNTVKIKLTGDRSSDFTRAYKEAGITKADATGYTWHHVADFDPKTGESTMQLIKTSTHEANLPHKGSAGQFADYFGVQYDSFETKMKSFEQGWRKEPKRQAKK